MPTRLVARVLGQLPEPKVMHYRGLPPELSGGKDLREPMGAAALLTIEEDSAGFSLVRFTAEGAVAGDTWHPTFEEAKEQARYEFGDLVSHWTPVPQDVDDVFSFGFN